MKLIVAFSLLALSLGLMGCGSGPGDQVKAFVQAMEDGDADKLKALSPGISRGLPDEKLDGLVTQAAVDMKKLGGVESVTINDEAIDGDIAVVSYTINYGDGSTVEDEIELVKIDGDWVITVETEDKEASNDLG